MPRGCAGRSPCGPQRLGLPHATHAAEGPLVEVVEVAPASAAGAIRVSGMVGYRREPVLAFTAAGVVGAIEVDSGDVVRRGQRLATLRRTGAGANVDEAALANGVVQTGALFATVSVHCQLRLQPGTEIIGHRARLYRASSGPPADQAFSDLVRVSDDTTKVALSTVSAAHAGGSGSWVTDENLAISEVVSTATYYLSLGLTADSGTDANGGRGIWAEIDVIRHTTREA